ncbi:MAG TPA: hypothetical protein VE988_17955 [Gemmataceae bacterium]|nr:hypothetical protein [Gemmataceae bacterium]
MSTNVEAVNAELIAIEEHAQMAVLQTFRLGQHALSICDQCDNQQGALTLISRAASVEVSGIRMAMLFAQWQQEEDSVIKLLERRGRYGYRVTWAHIVELLKTRDLTFREELVERAFANALTPKALAKAIRPPQRRKGRNDLRPRTITGMLCNVEGLAARLARRLKCDLDDIVILPLQDCTRDIPDKDKVVKGLQQTLRQLELVVDLAKRRTDDLTALVDWFGGK